MRLEQRAYLNSSDDEDIYEILNMLTEGVEVTRQYFEQCEYSDLKAGVDYNEQN